MRHRGYSDLTMAAQGDAVGARARLATFPPELRRRLETEPANATLWSELGRIEAVMGHPEEALRCARKAVELEPESINTSFGLNHRVRLAFVYGWTGDKDHALAEYAYLLRSPSFMNVHEMRSAPHYAPLRGDPRFEALLNDPKNNAPLF